MLDLSAAFDTLDHTILVQRLRDIGVSGLALAWFTSYLNGRTTAIKINNDTSPPAPLHHGVPQGSTLGPALFNVYCAPLAAVIARHNIQFHMYADDTQLYTDFTITDKLTAFNKIENCICDIKSWLSANKLLLNEQKTDVIELTSANMTESVEIKVGGQAIQAKTCVRNLGVHLDDTLSMYDHAKEICKTAYFHLHCIRKIRPCLTLDTCKMLIQSLVISRLDNCNAVLHNAPNDVIGQLERVQKSAARVIVKMYKNDRNSITDVLFSLHWLPIRARVHYKICVLMFNVYHFQSPPYLASLIKPRSFRRSTRTSVRGNFVEVPRFSSVRYSAKAFAVAGPTLWNNLDDDLREITSLDKFKSRLKTYLFKKHYHELLPQ